MAAVSCISGEHDSRIGHCSPAAHAANNRRWCLVPTTANSAATSLKTTCRPIWLQPPGEDRVLRLGRATPQLHWVIFGAGDTSGHGSAEGQPAWAPPTSVAGANAAAACAARRAGRVSRHQVEMRVVPAAPFRTEGTTDAGVAPAHAAASGVVTVTCIGAPAASAVWRADGTQQPLLPGAPPIALAAFDAVALGPVQGQGGPVALLRLVCVPPEGSPSDAVAVAAAGQTSAGVATPAPPAAPTVAARADASTSTDAFGAATTTTNGRAPSSPPRRQQTGGPVPVPGTPVAAAAAAAAVAAVAAVAPSPVVVGAARVAGKKRPHDADGSPNGGDRTQDDAGDDAPLFLPPLPLRDRPSGATGSAPCSVGSADDADGVVAVAPKATTKFPLWPLASRGNVHDDGTAAPPASAPHLTFLSLPTASSFGGNGILAGGAASQQPCPTFGGVLTGAGVSNFFSFGGGIGGVGGGGVGGGGGHLGAASLALEAMLGDVEAPVGGVAAPAAGLEHGRHLTRQPPAAAGGATTTGFQQANVGTREGYSHLSPLGQPPATGAAEALLAVASTPPPPLASNGLGTGGGGGASLSGLFGGGGLVFGEGGRDSFFDATPMPRWRGTTTSGGSFLLPFAEGLSPDGNTNNNNNASGRGGETGVVAAGSADGVVVVGGGGVASATAGDAPRLVSKFLLRRGSTAGVVVAAGAAAVPGSAGTTAEPADRQARLGLEGFAGSSTGMLGNGANAGDLGHGSRSTTAARLASATQAGLPPESQVVFFGADAHHHPSFRFSPGD